MCQAEIEIAQHAAAIIYPVLAALFVIGVFCRSRGRRID